MKLFTKDSTEFFIGEASENHLHVINDLNFNTDETKWITVCFKNEIGLSEESKAVGICSDNIAPGKPVELDAHKIETRKVMLRWKPPDVNRNAAKNYHIEYTEVIDSQKLSWLKAQCNITPLSQSERRTENHPAIEHSQPKNKTEINSTSEISGYETEIENLKPSTKYSFKVHACNNDSSGECAKIEDVTTKKDCSNKPPMPKCITFSDNDPQRAIIELPTITEEQMNGSPVSEVVIECLVDKWQTIDHKISPSQIVNINDSLSASGTVELPNLDKKIDSLMFRVSVKNEEGQSETSDVFQFPITKIPPGAPEDVVVYKSTPHSLTVCWKPPIFNKALTETYCIKYQQEGKSELKKIDLNSPNETSFEICKLQSYTFYVVQVFAVHGELTGPFTEVHCRTLEACPSAPQALHADKTGDNTIKIRWTRPCVWPDSLSLDC